jgi:glycosyltransferase involved in cell wall biosynthesis
VLDRITPLILTYDEAPNIARTLDRLRWAKRIVIVDSGSSDGTLDIVRGYPQVVVVSRPFDDFVHQWNYGLSQVTEPWVLSLDADYALSDELIDELGALAPAPEISGYRAGFIYRVQGRSLRGSLYPPRVVLFRKDRGVYRQEGHTQQLTIADPVLSLRGRIYHDDRKPLGRWLLSQRRYAQEEAALLLSQPMLGRADRIRRTGWAGPIAVFLYTLFVKRCLFDGWPGWYYAFQRTMAELLLALELIDLRLRDRAGSVAP